MTFFQRGNVVDRKDLNIMLHSGYIREWFIGTKREKQFIATCHESFPKGYTVDPKSGLLLRNPYRTFDMPMTALDIIFTRNSDLHYHTDVGEAIEVESGEGALYLFNKETLKFEKHELKFYKTSKFVPVGIPHCFETNEEKPLEIRLKCAGILKDENEIMLKRFDKWDGARLVDKGL